MNSRYYAIYINKRGKLQTVVEIEKFSRLARFVTETEQYRVNTHNECEVKITARSVCSKDELPLEEFKAANMDQVRRLALGG